MQSNVHQQIRVILQHEDQVKEHLSVSKKQLVTPLHRYKGNQRKGKGLPTLPLQPVVCSLMNCDRQTGRGWVPVTDRQTVGALSYTDLHTSVPQAACAQCAHSSGVNRVKGKQWTPAIAT